MVRTKHMIKPNSRRRVDPFFRSSKVHRLKATLIERGVIRVVIGLAFVLVTGGLFAPPTVVAQTPDGLPAALAVQQALVSAIESAEKSVVAIARVRRDSSRFRGFSGIGPRGGLGIGLDDPRLNPRSPEFIPNEYGAGVVVSKDGLILTAAHVLGDIEKNNYVVWVDRKSYYVENDSIRTDPWWDLAVLKIEAKDLKPIRMAEKFEPKRGKLVVAVGNPYAIARDGQASVTWGMISNIRRRAPQLRRREAGSVRNDQETLHESGTLMQTDARLEVGYSGGALIDLEGQMVGLTTAQAGRFGAAGQAGFAIPVDKYFLKALDDLKNNRSRDHGFLGLQIESGSAQPGVGVFVGPNSIPFRAGLRSGDRVTHVDGDEVRDSADLVGLVSRRAADEYVVLRVRSQGGFPRKREREVRVQLAKRPKLESSRGTWGGPKADWRGMQVDYYSAVSQKAYLRNRIGALARVGVLAVERDSLAWKAGVRESQAILKVDGESIQTPAAFYEAVKDATGTITIIDGLGQEHVVPPPQ
jgi:serine protease Do